MANYLASIFGTEQDKVCKNALTLTTEINVTCRSIALSTTKLVPAAMATVALENTLNLLIHKPSSFQTSTRTQPMTPKTR